MSSKTIADVTPWPGTDGYMKPVVHAQLHEPKMTVGPQRIIR